MRQGSPRGNLCAVSRSLTVPLALLLLCCGAEATDTSGREPRSSKPYRAPEPAVSDQQEALAEARCDYLARCDPDVIHEFAGSSREGCEALLACHEAHSPSLAGEALEGCIDSLRARDCPDSNLGAIGTFGSIFFMAWGEECGAPSPESVLVPPSDAPGVGEPCIDHHDESPACSAGAYCSATQSGPFGPLHSCGVCEPRLPEGAPCAEHERCVDGVACRLGVCLVPRLPGEACEQHDECQFHSCVAGTCASSSFGLETEPISNVLGRACDETTPCNDRVGTLICADGACRLRSDAGEPCSEERDCRLGQGCVDGRCFELGCTRDAGEPCSRLCSRGLCIDGVCADVGLLGDPCDAGCEPLLECFEGRCQSRARPLGAACDFDSQCSDGYCARDYGELCLEPGSCSIPGCDGCGTCEELPTVEECE
jgi:hypothetical protein